MKVLIVGLPYFGTYIQDKLSTNYPEHKFVYLNTYYNKKDQLSYLIHILNADVVYSINGVTRDSKTIDVALKMKKKIIYHWVGSDLINAKNDFKNGLINTNYINDAVHLADSPWFVDELKQIGISAVYCPLNAYKVGASDNEMNFPDKFTVLNYIKEGSEEFYGFNDFISLAKHFPEINFHIAGMSNANTILPENVKLLAWVDDMKVEIQNSVACLRMPKHDGLSFFVLESLGEQRYVIYNQPFEPCIMANSLDTAKQSIQMLYERFCKGELELNTKGSEYVEQHFNEKEVVSNLFRILSQDHE